MPLEKIPLTGQAFLAFEEKLNWLQDELCTRFNADKNSLQIFGDLIYSPAALCTPDNLPYWASCVMLQPFFLTFDSVGQAAAGLKEIQRNWAPYQFTLFRRAALIQDKLPYVNLKDRAFPYQVPQSQIGLYTLTENNKLIASAQTTSFLPAGRIRFIEDHENPPSRAYLKIQEALVHFQSTFGKFPKQGERCFEAGACPGGWTWVLTNLGCKVFAVDRSPLADDLMKNPLVTFLAHDAFTLKAEDIGDVDWVFSDVICYPERLYEWVNYWLGQKKVPNMICTIKMQGETDWNLIEDFAQIPDSKVLHLNYNKHELTWMHCACND
ncbi:MAG: SAM-dependent methyltransferase [Treponemataceae bacterium]|nr:SAM-dependent methyltransferase [Treponemataceae bacterium]